ncbi:MFS transporter [Microbacterium sp.]|uniref:MFS transporter n=1 Tax=Microbacterium sp. TaxID=51671 RepID=UPI00260F98E2|nr:MFS transporter [Microbacterium sp.]
MARFYGAALGRSFAALRVRDYRRWSLVQLLSGTGNAAAQIAIAWQVVQLGGNGIALGAVTGGMMLPTLLLGPFIGALVDRYARRVVLLITATVQSLLLGSLSALAFSGVLQLWMLIVFAVVHGVAFAADNPARQLLVMDIVGRERLTSAVSMNEVIINGSRVLGPALAGFLLVATEAAWCFVLGAAVFLPSIIVLVRLQPMRQTQAVPQRRPEIASGDIATGERRPWRFVATTAPVRATLVLAVCAAASYNIAVVVPLIVADVFHADGGTYGALAVAFGLGALPGALASATGPTTPRSSEVRMLALAMAATVLLAAAAPTLPLLFVALGSVGAVVMWFIARANAFVMLTAPKRIRGRVMGIWAMALPGSTVVTGLAVGALADFTDPRLAYGVVGVVTGVVVGLCWRALRALPETSEPLSAND